MGALRIEKENAVRTEGERKHHEIEQRRRELELIMAERDHHLEAAQRELRNRTEELETLKLAEKTSSDEATQRQDEVVRKRDDKLLEEQSDRSKPASAGVKKRRKSK
jgi:hypothetical protein